MRPSAASIVIWLVIVLAMFGITIAKWPSMVAARPMPPSAPIMDDPIASEAGVGAVYSVCDKEHDVRVYVSTRGAMAVLRGC